MVAVSVAWPQQFPLIAAHATGVSQAFNVTNYVNFDKAQCAIDDRPDLTRLTYTASAHQPIQRIRSPRIRPSVSGNAGTGIKCSPMGGESGSDLSNTDVLTSGTDRYCSAPTQSGAITWRHLSMTGTIAAATGNPDAYAQQGDA
jgi:hypothetical protein